MEAESPAPAGVEAAQDRARPAPLSPPHRRQRSGHPDGRTGRRQVLNRPGLRRELGGDRRAREDHHRLARRPQQADPRGDGRAPRVARPARLGERDRRQAERHLRGHRRPLRPDRDIRESVEYPLLRSELYRKVGVDPPKGVLLIGSPGTGKTLVAKAVAHHTHATFVRLVGSELVQKYIGEGARLVRELFQLAKDKAPTIIFIDEIDSIGAKRLEVATSGTGRSSAP